MSNTEMATQAKTFREAACRIKGRICGSHANDYEAVAATGHSRNPHWSGYDLCGECIAEFDGRVGQHGEWVEDVPHQSH